MTPRQAYPLLLAHACGGAPVRGRTRFQKMIFLMREDLKDDARVPNLGFAPFDYGPYSKTLQRDIDTLTSGGLIGEDRSDSDRTAGTVYTYTITEAGSERAGRLLSDPGCESYGFRDAYEKLEEIKDRFNDVSLPDLLKHVYAKYPEYAALSKYEVW